MERGWVYLAAIIDWYSRKVLAWDVSISMEADFCVRVLDAALTRHGKTEIFNTDQGSQFTSLAFTERLKAAGMRSAWTGAVLARQRVRRAAVAEREVRGAGIRRPRLLHEDAREDKQDAVLANQVNQGRHGGKSKSMNEPAFRRQLP